jgi:hypothetical protein
MESFTYAVLRHDPGSIYFAFVNHFNLYVDLAEHGAEAALKAHNARVYNHENSTFK